MRSMRRADAEEGSAPEQASVAAKAAAGALLLAAALSANVEAQTPAPSAQTGGAPRPVSGQSQLIEQARFWAFQGRVDLAVESLQRVLQSEPNNPAALYEMAKAQLSQGDVASARDFAARLRRVVGEGGLYAQLKRELDTANIDQRALGEARTLAGRGEYANALALYDRALRGQSPQGSLAIEYYETMAGIKARAAEARGALERLAEQSPSNKALTLALARVRTYDEATRRAAIDQLLDLADSLAFRPQALDAARQGLIWLTADETDKPLYDRYFEFRTDDADVRAKWAKVSEPQGEDRLAVSRSRGYAYLEENRLKDAEAEFASVLDEDRRDAEATAGLGIVRGRQERFAEAEDLLRRAIRLDANKRMQFEEALEAIAFAAELREARRAAERGDPELASSILADLSPPNAGDRAQIALVRAEGAVRVQDWNAAEVHYREAYDLSPRNDDAFAGLITVLIETRQADQLEALVRDGARGISRRNAVGRAAIARAQGWMAAERGEVRQAASWYSDALSLDPKNPWLRLSAARALSELGRDAEADQLFARAQGANDTDLAQAAALYRADQGDWGAAVELLSAIPAAQRSPEAVRLMARAQTQLGVTRAKLAAAAGEKTEARRALINLYAAGATSADDGLLIAGALVDIGDQTTAAAVVRESVSASRGANVAQLSGAVRILMASGDLGGASGILDGLAMRARSMPAVDRVALAALHDDFMVAQARAALATDDPNMALDLLTAIYRSNPAHPGALRALGELNLKVGRREDSLAFYLAALDLNPNDRDALRGAVGASNAMKRYDDAKGLINSALLRAPGDPDLYLLAADTAKAAGDRAGAIAALETARRLDRPGAAAGMTFSAMGPLASNPFRSASDRAFAFDAPAPVAEAPTPPPRPSAATNPRAVQSDYERDDTDASPQPALMQISAGIDDLMFRPPGTFEFQPLQPQLYTAIVSEAPAERMLARTSERLFIPIAAVEGGRDLKSRLEALGAPGRETPTKPNISAPKEQLRPSSYYQREIAELEGEDSLSLSEGVGLRWRDGEKGLSQLTEIKAPFVFDTPLGDGRLGLNADAVFLDAGQLTGDVVQARRFGALATVAPDGRPIPDNGAAGGLGLGLTYSRAGFKAELGTSPLGFEVVNIIGGVGYDHRFENGVGIGLSLRRKPVTDSVLSYSGSVDPVTGEQFGGAIDTRVNVKADQTFGRVGVYVNAGFGITEAVESDSNTVIQLDGGSFATLYQSDNQRFASGFNVTYLGYSENRRHFTLGHGGYFSPQTYFSAAIPLNYSYENGPLTLELATALGVQYFSEDSADYFPGRGDLQRLADEVAAEEQADIGSTTRLKVRYDAMSETTIAARAGVKATYRIAPALALGGEFSIDRAADWTEVIGLVKLTYWPQIGKR